MLADALFVFFEVCVALGLAIFALWLAGKAAGYIAMVLEGEPLAPGIREDVESGKRELRRNLRETRHPRPTV